MLAQVPPSERWTITEEKLRLAVAEIVDLASPERVILFGSHARGDHRPDSDADLMVIEHEVTNVAAEMVRLRHALRPLLAHWSDPWHPHRERFAGQREWIESVLASAESPEKLDARLRAHGATLRTVSRESHPFSAASSADPSG